MSAKLLDTRPRWRDRLLLAWLAITGDDRDAVREVAERVAYPPSVRGALDRAYVALDQELYCEARDILRDLENALGTDDPKVSDLRWSVESEDAEV